MHASRARERRRQFVALALLLALPLLMFRWFEQAQVFHPTARWDATPDAVGRPGRAVEFPAGDGVSLSGWYFPASPTSPRQRLVVLLCHGNGGNISHRLDYYAILLDLGVNVLAFDYRGYGRSAGRPSEAGTYRDVEGAFRWLSQQGFVASNVVVLGESLGGGVATHLAAREPVAGLILHSTFTSIPDLGAELFPWLPVRRLATIRYDSRERLPQVEVPVLLLHSREDRMIGFQHAERNFAAAREPKFLREVPGDHNDQPACAPGRFRDVLESFLAFLEIRPQPLPPDARPR